MTALLSLRGVRKEYGGVVPVQEVTLDVHLHEVCALIGPNGAGKTTLINLISGLVPLTRGEIVFAGRDVTQYSARQLARVGVARTFQITSIFPSHTPYESIWVAVQSRRSLWNSLKSSAARREVNQKTEEIIAWLDLDGVRDTPAGLLSYGDQRVLEFGIALAREPSLLLLDEPTAGMSPAETARLVEIVGKLKDKLTVLIIEHDMEVVRRLASRVCVLDRGVVVAEGSAREIADNSLVQSIYLGAA